MDEKHYDLIVIGSGPGGEGASIKAAKSGKSVAIVERYLRVGGGCTHLGTIPSKSLIHVIQQLSEIRRTHVFEDALRDFQMSYADVMAAVWRVVDEQVEERRGYYSRNRIDVIGGHASFVDAHTIDVVDSAGVPRRYTADAFVIAAGSRPYHPPDVDFTSHRVLDSDTVLGMTEVPQSMTIYGAGVIGCEYASAFRGLGIKINLINTRARLLEFLDDEITDALSYHLRDQGVLIRHNEEYERVEVVDDGVILHMKTGKKIKSDVLLWANGRTGNSNGMGLEALGIQIDHRGNLVVDEDYRTTQPHVYAVGDIIGFPALSSAAYDQGRFVGTIIGEGRIDRRLVRGIPTGIYTTPEISTLGKTERELTAERVPYEVGHAFFKTIARAQITGHRVGMLKILFHRDTLELLGIHCFGYQAAEILHIGQAVMMQDGPANSLEFFTTTTFNYPTMAEAYRVAALNGLNRIF